MSALAPDSRIYVAGHRGMVGAALLSAADATMYAAKRTGHGLVLGDARLPG